MTSYTKNLVDDFKNADDIDYEDLKIEINNVTSVDILYISRIGNFITFNFNGTLTTQDMTNIDNIVSSYEFVNYTNKVFIYDKKDIGTNGGTFIHGIWLTRQLNTIRGNVKFLTISNNQFTLLPGEYEIHAHAPAFNVGSHQIMLYNTTTGNIHDYGSIEISEKNISTTSSLDTIASISEETTYEVRHICSATYFNIGLGSSGGFTDEIYCKVYINRL